MQISKFILLLATSAFLFPGFARASEIDVRAGKVRVNTYPDGRIYVNTGPTRFSVPPARSYWRYRTPDRYIRQNGFSCQRNFSRQESTQITRSGRTIQQTYISRDRC